MIAHEIVQRGTVYNIYETVLTEVDHQAIARDILDILVRFPKENNVELRNNFNTTHSHFNIHRDTDVFNAVIKVISAKISQTFNLTENVKLGVERSWCASYSKNDNTGWHSHPTAYNTVYYPYIEDDTPIIFENEQTGTNFEIRPKTGTLIMFLSGIRHRVPEVQSDKKRIIFVSDYGDLNAPRTMMHRKERVAPPRI